MVGLGGVDVVGVSVREGEPLEVVVCLKGRPRCRECGEVVWSKGKRDVRLADGRRLIMCGRGGQGDRVRVAYGR